MIVLLIDFLCIVFLHIHVIMICHAQMLSFCTLCVTLLLSFGCSVAQDSVIEGE